MIRFPHPLRAPLLAAALASALLLAACGGSDGGDVAAFSPVKTFEQSEAPDKLSAWNFVVSDGKKLTLNATTVPYDLNSALFSDYAFKLRAVYVPAGKQVGYNADGTLDFPVGTAIAKTFYYPRASGTDAAYTGVARRLQDEQGESIDLTTHVVVETRILFRQADGSWTGLPYVWDADQKDATLQLGGATAKLELVPAAGATEKFDYGVPNAQQCQKCHSTANAGGKGILPIGPKARNLNKSYAYDGTLSANQLEHWNSLKMLSGYPPGGGAGQCRLDRHDEAGRGPREGLSGRQLRALPQPGRQRAAERPDARLRDHRLDHGADPVGRVQEAAGLRRPRRAVPLRHRAGQGR